MNVQNQYMCQTLSWRCTKLSFYCIECCIGMYKVIIVLWYWILCMQVWNGSVYACMNVCTRMCACVCVSVIPIICMRLLCVRGSFNYFISKYFIKNKLLNLLNKFVVFLIYDGINKGMFNKGRRNLFYIMMHQHILWLCGVRHMVCNHSDSERENPLSRLNG